MKHCAVTAAGPGLSRRTWLAGATGAALFTFAPAVLAGSYLDRASVLLANAAREADFLRARLADRELARVLHRVALGRLEGARHMHVPKEVVAAHPHLLLCLGEYEQATAGAAEGSAARFLKHQLKARKEEKTFIGILKQLGWTLPPAP